MISPPVPAIRSNVNALKMLARCLVEVADVSSPNISLSPVTTSSSAIRLTYRERSKCIYQSISVKSNEIATSVPRDGRRRRLRQRRVRFNTVMIVLVEDARSRRREKIERKRRRKEVVAFRYSRSFLVNMTINVSRENASPLDLLFSACFLCCAHGWHTSVCSLHNNSNE